MKWPHSSSPKPKKFRTKTSAGKFMLTLFWDQKGVILEHYMPRGNTVTSASYSDLLKNHLRPAIKTKQHGLLSTGVILHHDNARPHFARATAVTIENLHFECLPHPPYSPDFAPSDYHMFGPLKEALGMKRYTEQCMTGCTANQKTFFPQDFRHFVSVGEFLLNVGEIMYKNDADVFLIHSINYF
jgi:hypothetical protein